MALVAVPSLSDQAEQRNISPDQASIRAGRALLEGVNEKEVTMSDLMIEAVVWIGILSIGGLIFLSLAWVMEWAYNAIPSFRRWIENNFLFLHEQEEEGDYTSGASSYEDMMRQLAEDDSYVKSCGRMIDSSADSIFSGKPDEDGWYEV